MYSSYIDELVGVYSFELQSCPLHAVGLTSASVHFFGLFLSSSTLSGDNSYALKHHVSQYVTTSVLTLQSGRQSATPSIEPFHFNERSPSQTLSLTSTPSLEGSGSHGLHTPG